MAANSIVESDLAQPQERAPQGLDEPRTPVRGQQGGELQEPSAAHILAELRTSGLSLDDIATRSDAPRRTLEDIELGRSSGVRTLSRLQPLLAAARRQQEERGLFERLRDQLHQQILQEQSAQIMEMGRAAAAMEVAAWHREQEMQLYQAAVRYLGKKGEVLASVCGRTPAGRQMLVQMAQTEHAAEARRARMWQMGNQPALFGSGGQQRLLAAPSRIAGQPQEYWTPGQPLTQEALAAAHGADCGCTTCVLAPWRR
jgi:hypothetical protein